MNYRLPTLAAVVLTLAGSSVARAEDKKAGANPFVHTVIFYLKDDAPADTADKIVADCHGMLAKIPNVRLLRAGKPAEGPAGGPTKRDFAVGLMILFDDAAALKTYADHPLHKQFVSKYLKYFDPKVTVFDFVEPKK